MPDSTAARVIGDDEDFYRRLRRATEEANRA